MKNSTVIVGLVLAVIGLMYIGRNQVKSVLINTDTALADGNVQAMLAMIGHFEGGDRYDLLYHTPHDDPLYDPSLPLYFTDFSTHPNIRIPFTDPRTGNPNFSTAAGMFQITHPTWLGLHLLPGAPADFWPEAQKWYAVQLLKADGALAPLMAGNFAEAVKLASRTWASLPGSTSGQAQISLARAEQVYTQAGGAIA